MDYITLHAKDRTRRVLFILLFKKTRLEHFSSNLSNFGGEPSQTTATWDIHNDIVVGFGHGC
jgi:hypothetical protein